MKYGKYEELKLKFPTKIFYLDNSGLILFIMFALSIGFVLLALLLICRKKRKRLKEVSWV